MMNVIPSTFTDPINAKILAVSEDRLQGFQRDPFGEISRQSGVELSEVIERIQAMLRAGTIRRVRQTLLATNLAQGALVAWQVPEEKLDAAFDYMFQQDPFSGPCGDPHHRHADRRRQVPTLDDAEGPAGILDGQALRVSRAADGRGAVPPAARKEAVRARRRPRAPPRAGAGQPRGGARPK